MPSPAITLRVKKFRRRFGITAPRVAVRAHHGWHWNTAILAGGGAVIAVLAWSFAQYGETAALKAELSTVREQLQGTQGELGRYRQSSGTEQNVVEMERTAQRQLASRLKALEAENAGLKEEIALFERLVPPAAGNETLVRVERLRVSKDGDGGLYRYRLLLGFQGTKQIREFRGRLQLRVNYAVGGRDQQLALPAQGDSAAEYQVDIRHFLRKEGVITLPPGARLKGVEASVFQGDTLKAKGSAQL